MGEDSYILAMYDIRGKQNYIYKSGKMKEIVGASLIIRDCFSDYLFPAAKKVAANGIYSYQVEKNDKEYRAEPFSRDAFRDRVETGGYAGEVVYAGGGNFLVLYKNFEVYREINRIFYRSLLMGTYSLRVLTSYIENVDFDHYDIDSRNLYKLHAVKEREESLIYPVNSLPFVQVDYQSSLPLAKKTVTYGMHEEKVSLESAAKYNKYKNSVDRKTEGAKILDDLIAGKGVDSHLAVIYIDGNNMGAKVQEKTDNCSTYDESVTALRQFSCDIQKYYIDIPMEKIDQYFIGLPQSKRKNQKRRFVIYAGDEITFVCSAEYAYDIVQEYFKALEGNGIKKKGSSCAGVAIFHSHAPYAEAYRIAEECCESGKALMKEKGIDEACFMDFHYCQGAIGTSLEDIRIHEGTDGMCTPWLIQYKGSDAAWDHDIPNKGRIEEVKEILQSIAYGNSKGLLYAAKSGDTAFRKEIARIRAHLSEKERKEKMSSGILKPDAISSLTRDRELVYRMMMVYDLWFRKPQVDQKDREGEKADE